MEDVLSGESADGAALAAAFPEAPEDGRVLVVGPEEGRPELPRGLEAKGWQVDTVPFYRTVPSAAAPELARGLVEGRWRRALWASPSGVRAIGDADDGALCLSAERGTGHVAIGRATAAALAEKQVEAVVSDSPEDDDLYAALVLPSDASGEETT